MINFIIGFALLMSGVVIGVGITCIVVVGKESENRQMLNTDELSILQEIINEETENYLQSGYKLTDEYVIRLRNILKKLNLKEIYNFDKRFKE